MLDSIDKFKLKKYFSDQLAESQRWIEHTFAYKWTQKNIYYSGQSNRRVKEWLVERYCKGEINKLESWLDDSSKIILDAGDGVGYSAALLFGPYPRSHQYLGVDISSLTFPDESADVTVSEGVLLHTDYTEQTYSHLYTKLKLDGYFIFLFFMPIVKNCDSRIYR